jgi:SAM-dependent methyltransferase
MTSLIIFLKKVKNTFLTPRWNTIYSSFDKIFSKNKQNKLLFWFLDKFWFFPYDLQARYWHNADYNSRHYFIHYKSLDYDAKQLIKNIKKYTESKNNKILDLGCNIGRHLNELKKSGYTNLYGVDIGKVPVKNSKKIFPNLKKTNIKCSSFEEYLFKTKDNFFKIIYSHGATIEMTKPTFPLVSELSRVLDKSGYLILLIDENGHRYPRFWRYEFQINKLSIVHARNIFKNRTIFVIIKNN